MNCLLFNIYIKIIFPSLTCLLTLVQTLGSYSQLLKSYFPANDIIAAEPNPLTFKKLKHLDLSISCVNLAFGKESRTMVFYTSAEDPYSTNASFSKSSIPEGETIKELNVNCFKLDDYLEEINYQSIGLLKIDTEGHDFEVLLGTIKNLFNINFIQFEFNEKYVYTRTFLKDFYELLNETHLIYRIDTNCLRDITNYNTHWEIFRYQNLLAIKKDIAKKIPASFIKTPY